MKKFKKIKKLVKVKGNEIKRDKGVIYRCGDEYTETVQEEIIDIEKESKKEDKSKKDSETEIENNESIYKNEITED